VLDRFHLFRVLFFSQKRKKKLVAENADPQTEARAAKIEKQAR